MICTISGETTYLIKGSPNQTHKSKIDSICEPYDTNMFFINITIKPLHTNTPPQTPSITIGFGTHCHNHATTTVYPSYPFGQCLKQRFQPAVTCLQVIADNTTADTHLLKQNDCDLSKLLQYHVT